MKIIGTLIISFLITVSSNVYADYKNQESFIYCIKEQVDEILTNKNKQERYKKLQEIIKSSINLSKISKFIMGKHWITATKKEREDFIREYEKYFTKLCIKILHTYIGSGEITIVSTKKIDTYIYLINTRFSYDESEGFINIDFKITENNDTFLIEDIIMSGVSISINQRSQINEKIDNQSIENIVEELKCSNNL